MKKYIKWFVEEVMKSEYCSEETIELWIAQRTNARIAIENIKIPHCYQEQMTIYDVAS
ncbi:hypothetical protein [Staphylococcus simulans]|uniref:hypothetical protein n=1 Tax=Staphylococcus simulans TaxID=1286 RepID=UPI001304FFB3|nr:hypothetical protein [Staphylococcus simulans]